MGPASTEEIPTVLFICMHGSAKSVIAMLHLRRLAVSRRLRFTAASAGIEPDTEIPPHVVEGLRDDGLDAGGLRPRRLNASDLRTAWRVISFGCDVEHLGPVGREIERWENIPNVTDGYAGARSAIVARVTALLDRYQAFGHGASI